MTKAGKMAPVPKAVADSVFYSNGKQSLVSTAQFESLEMYFAVYRNDLLDGLNAIPPIIYHRLCLATERCDLREMSCPKLE